MSDLLLLFNYLNEISAVNSYPAFSRPLTEQDVVHNFITDSEMVMPLNVEQSSSKRRRIIPEPTMEVDEEDVQDSTGINEASQRVATFKELVPIAKPAPFYPGINFGAVADVPFLPGLVFPYFHGLTTVDFQLIPGIVWTYFLQSFGRDKEAYVRGFKRFEDGQKSWAESTEGLELQHIFFGIKLALETQSRVYFVHTHGRYNGFVMLGEGFSVIAQEKEYGPVSADQVRVELQSISLHDIALKEICELLSNATLGNSRKRRAVTTSSISGYRQLYQEANARKIDGEEKETILRLTNDLSFPERFWKVSPATIDTLLDVYVNNDGVHPNEAPMYIGSGLLFETSQAYLALSVFGPTAPSFFTIGGEKKDIPDLSRPDPLSAIDPETKRQVLPFIPYTMKSMRTAMQDLYKVYKDRAVFILPKERAGPSRTTQFTGKSRNEIWTSLRTHIGSRKEEDQNAKGAVTTADEKRVVGGNAIEYGDELDF